MRIASRYGVGCRIAGLLIAALVVPQTAEADIQHLDDVIISFSLCVGNDCANGENFGFDTIRLKENNLRMHFDDTSTSASFPNNDWRFVANDSSNGGDNFMAIEDSTAGRQIFRVDAGAPANSLRVDSAGDVGIGTSNPVVDAHIVSGNTPTLRLEQNGSSGFASQTWDLAGNEANFFLRDVTNGSQLPFRVKPGADSDSIFIDADNDIGIGTDSINALADLHLLRSSGDAELRIDAPNATTAQARVVLNNNLREISIINSGGRLDFFNLTDGFRMMGIQAATGFVGFNIGNASPASPIEVGTDATNGNGATLTTAGVWMDASTRKNKERIVNLDTEVALEAFNQLQTVTYYGKGATDEEQYVGFIAEDVPELVAMNSRKGIAAIEIAALVTKVVQHQRDTIESQKETIATLVERVEKLEASQTAE